MDRIIIFLICFIIPLSLFASEKGSQFIVKDSDSSINHIKNSKYKLLLTASLYNGWFVGEIGELLHFQQSLGLGVGFQYNKFCTRLSADWLSAGILNNTYRGRFSDEFYGESKVDMSNFGFSVGYEIYSHNRLCFMPNLWVYKSFFGSQFIEALEQDFETWPNFGLEILLLINVGKKDNKTNHFVSVSPIIREWRFRSGLQDGYQLALNILYIAKIDL